MAVGQPAGRYSARHTPWSQNAPAAHCALVEHSGWHVALMQRKAVPQSESHKHCAVIGAASLQTPLVQVCPRAQSLVPAHALWHCPATHWRPWPQAVSFWQSTTLAVPQVDPPFS